MRGILVAVAIVLFAGSACTASPSVPDPASPEAAVRTVLVAPESRTRAPLIAGPSLDGTHVDLEALQGHVVVVNTWGSWCGPCREEAPILQAANADMRSQGVRFIGINTRDRDAGSARTFEKRYGLSFPSLYDPPGRLLLRFPAHILNPQAIPSTVIVDRKGRIAAAIAGPISAQTLRDTLSAVIREGP